MDAKPADAPATSPPLPVPDPDLNAPFPMLSKMDLYNNDRVSRALRTLHETSHSEDVAPDTSALDSMHYLGDEAIEHAASQLGPLQPGQRVLDLGSGYGGTGRYLHRKYGVTVVGVELQEQMHRISQEITAWHKLQEHVHSVQCDFLEVNAEDPGLKGGFDYIVSFLCILHIPDRTRLFEKAASVLKPGGKIYIEDYYAQAEMDEWTAAMVETVVSCPYLPSRETYVRDLEKAGFGNVQFQDVTERWRFFVWQRARGYKLDEEKDATVEKFYDEVDTLFRQGVGLGGCRITAELSG